MSALADVARPGANPTDWRRPCLAWSLAQTLFRRSHPARLGFDPRAHPGRAPAERNDNERRSGCRTAQRSSLQGKPIPWGVTSESYDAVRRAWLIHVHAEEVLFKPFTEDVFKTQMEVMLSVFIDDCVMEIVPAGARWEAMGKRRSSTASSSPLSKE